jgi:hypothetical protein
MNTRRLIYALTVTNIALLALLRSLWALPLLNRLQPCFEGVLSKSSTNRVACVPASASFRRADPRVAPPIRRRFFFASLRSEGAPQSRSAVPKGHRVSVSPDLQGTMDTYLILEAQGNVSSLKLRNEDGRERIIAP